MQQPSWLAPAGVFRFLGSVRASVAGRLRETPLVFFAVVLGVALTFRVAIGWVRPPAEPEASATGVARLVSAPHPRGTKVVVTPVADPSAAPLPGAAARAAGAMPGVDPGPTARPRRRPRAAH